jgi:hypothetical protein
MRTNFKIFSLAAAVLAFCALLSLAQTPEKQQVKFKPKNLKVTGCLQAGSSDTEFTLTSQEGKKYELTSGRIPLKNYVGRKVQVSGIERGEQENIGVVRVMGINKISNSCQ